MSEKKWNSVSSETKLPGRMALRLSWGNRIGWGPWDWTPRDLNVEAPTEEGSWVSFHISFWFVLPLSSQAAKGGRETVFDVYTTVCIIKKAFQDAEQYCLQYCLVLVVYAQATCVCVETTVSKRHWYADGSMCQMPLPSQMAATPSSSSSIQPVPLLTPNSPVGRPLPVWTDSNSTRISQILFSP